VDLKSANNLSADAEVNQDLVRLSLSENAWTPSYTMLAFQDRLDACIRNVNFGPILNVEEGDVVVEHIFNFDKPHGGATESVEASLLAAIRLEPAAHCYLCHRDPRQRLTAARLLPPSCSEERGFMDECNYQSKDANVKCELLRVSGSQNLDGESGLLHRASSFE
jgi:hypothetical protein